MKNKRIALVLSVAVFLGGVLLAAFGAHAGEPEKILSKGVRV